MMNKSGSPAPPPVAEHSAPISMAAALPISVGRSAAVGPSAAVGTFMPPASRKRRGRGRPSAENAEDVRKKLLDAARDLFPRYGYRGVSSRRIGGGAGGDFA